MTKSELSREYGDRIENSQNRERIGHQPSGWIRKNFRKPGNSTDCSYVPSKRA